METDRLIPLISAAVTDSQRSVQGAAILALRQLDDDAVLAVPALVDLLDDESPTVRASAAFALGSMGPRAEGAIDELIETLKRSSDDTPTIANAISRIGPAAVPALLRASADPEHSPQRLATALAEVGRGATQPLIKALQGESLPARVSAAHALGGMNPTPDEAIDSLVICLNDPSDDLRAAAATALGQCSELESDQVVSLRALTTDEEFCGAGGSRCGFGQG